MNYGITVWGKQSSKLITLQKKAIRVIMKTGYRAHTDILFKDLFFLKIKDLCALLDYIFCYKFINHLLPDYFLTYLSDDYEMRARLESAFSSKQSRPSVSSKQSMKHRCAHAHHGNRNSRAFVT